MDVSAMQSALCLLDQPIREALKEILRQLDSSAAIIDELPLLRGRGRADLAFVNGELCGFEIKSEADSLVRLGIQKDNYESVFEFNTIVAARKHLDAARKKIPVNWGIIEAKQLDGKTALFPRRQAQRNFKLSKPALVQLLWKNECRLILKNSDIRTGPHTPVIELWNLMESLSTEHLCSEVREALKRRRAKAVEQQTPCGDSRTIAATE
jgi:hypothetical protein